MTSKHFLPLLLSLCGCGVDSTPVRTLPATIRLSAPVQTAGNWSIGLSRARLSFGALYFCASQAASAELCDVAIAEWADAGNFDLLAPSAAEFGPVRATSGRIQSARFDFGTAWLGTWTDARRLPSGEPSLVVEGVATRQTTDIPFVVSLDLSPQARGTNAVQGRTFSEVNVDSIASLSVLIPLDQWLGAIDFESRATAPGAFSLSVQEQDELLLRMTSINPPSFVWQNTTEQSL